MTTRITGLVPAFALLAMGVAHAQVVNQTGSMAFPTPLPSGEVRVTAPTVRDTGNMATPAPSGGISEPASRGRDTGNMALPTGGGSLATTTPAVRMSARAKQMAARGEPAMRADVAPTPAQTATAHSLDAGPASAPVPYTDFLPPAKPMGKMAKGKKGKPVHHAVMRKAAKAAPAAAATPAAATPAAPAK